MKKHKSYLAILNESKHKFSILDNFQSHCFFIFLADNSICNLLHCAHFLVTFPRKLSFLEFNFVAVKSVFLLGLSSLSRLQMKVRRIKCY